MIVNRKTIRSKGPLVIPREMLKQIDGWERRRISVVITDPRSRHLILTRYPDRHKVWASTTINRGMDFIPTTMLKKAKVHKDKEFTIRAADGELVIRRVP
jgi:antitoxin component of MazEF toxin-antitoxin module